MEELESMRTIAVTKARSILYSLIEEVFTNKEPVHITGKRSNAVLISEDDWLAIQETLYLLSIPGMRESIKKGLDTPVQKCVEDVGW